MVRATFIPMKRQVANGEIYIPVGGGGVTNWKELYSDSYQMVSDSYPKYTMLADLDFEMIDGVRF